MSRWTSIAKASKARTREREKILGENEEERERENAQGKQIKSSYSVTSLAGERYNRPNVVDDNNMANGLSSIRSGYRCRHAKTHYLDDSDEEILTDDILEITHYDHYPTLLERWGDDTKTIVRHEGDLKIEDYVEFEELEPTTVEEIVYRVVYAGDETPSYVPIHTCRSQSRNFRKLKKRRTKRKIQLHDVDGEHIRCPMNTSDVDDRARDLLNGMHDLSKQIDLILETGERVTHSIDDLAGADESRSVPTITEGLPDVETRFAASGGKSSIFVDSLETREGKRGRRKTSTRLGLAGERKHRVAINIVANEEF